MNNLKPPDLLKLFKQNEREPSLGDPAGIRICLRELHHQQTHFQVKVEQAQTTPYTVYLARIEGNGLLILRFQRALPPELAQNAPFRMNFDLQGQPCHAQSRYLERVGFMQYRFTAPEKIFQLERRADRRFPFRPRERASVTVRDGLFPGLGASGPLLNLSMAGLAFRVDRVVHLEGGLRLPISSTHFPYGKGFILVRIQDLPDLPVLNLHGQAIHATTKKDVLIVGIGFGELDASNKRPLEQVLQRRQQVLERRSLAAGSGSYQPPSVTSTTGQEGVFNPQTDPWDPAEVLNESTDPSGKDASTEEEDPISLLKRRSSQFLLLVPDASELALLETKLMKNHYRRCLSAISLSQAIQICRGKKIQLLLVDEHLSAIPGLEMIQELRDRCSLDEVPAILLSHQPNARLASQARTANVEVLSKPVDFEGRLLESLDHLMFGVETSS